MRVNVEIIRKMNPCKNRFDDNFLIHYPNFDSDLEDFLSLDEITYDDKIWVCKKLLNKNQLVHFAVLCAQSVLSIYQNKYPNDLRVKNCLDYLATITDFTDLDNYQREKLLNFRKECRNTADAAAYAADYAAYAAYTADDAAYADYAAYAAYAAAYAADVRKTQEDLNLQFLLIASKL